MMENKVCPGCGRHCPADSLSCDRGRDIMARGGDAAQEENAFREERRFRDGAGPGPRHGEREEGRTGPCRGPHGRGPHGPGRPGFGHGPHRHRGPMQDITRSEAYAELETGEKLAVMLRELSHTGRFLLESRGGRNRILELLARENGMTQRALTERIGIQPGSASEILGKLEEAGLIVRTPNEADRRTADLRLTDAGRDVLEAGRAEREGRVRTAFDCLSAEERETFLALAEKLYADWRSRLRDRKPEDAE